MVYIEAQKIIIPKKKTRKMSKNKNKLVQKLLFTGARFLKGERIFSNLNHPKTQ